MSNEEKTAIEGQETLTVDEEAETEQIEGDATGNWVLKLFYTCELRQALLV